MFIVSCCYFCLLFSKSVKGWLTEKNRALARLLFSMLSLNRDDDAEFWFFWASRWKLLKAWKKEKNPLRRTLMKRNIGSSRQFQPGLISCLLFLSIFRAMATMARGEVIELARLSFFRSVEVVVSCRCSSICCCSVQCWPPFWLLPFWKRLLWSRFALILDSIYLCVGGHLLCFDKSVCIFTFICFFLFAHSLDSLSSRPPSSFDCKNDGTVALERRAKC